MKNVIVTAGGTREYIDDVRVLTNISSGKLGKMIVDQFLMEDKQYNIHYICPKGAFVPDQDELNMEMYHKGVDIDVYLSKLTIHYITDVKSVMEIMNNLVPEMDIVIHSMAVSDFGFYPIKEKLKSSDSDVFIESLKSRIFKTPKILSQIKIWNPNCKLISFKFEVNLDHKELMKIANKSLMDNDCDYVVANDKSEMVKNKAHIAYISDGYKEIMAFNKEDVAEKIFELVK